MQMARDAKGDFVVVWAQDDHTIDTDGSTVTDSNIYAEYLTNDVQRIALPAQVLTHNIANKYATVAITYGGDTVQSLAISATTASNFDPHAGIPTNAADTVSGNFTLTYTAGNGTTYTTDPIQFNEGSYDNRSWSSKLAADISDVDPLTFTDTTLQIDGSFVLQVGDERIEATGTVNPDGSYSYTFQRGFDGTTATSHSKGDLVSIVSNETLIQEALRKTGTDNNLAELKTVTITASDSQHYQIDFNDNNPATNLNVNQLTVTDATWDTGFLPTAEVTTISKPIVIGGIKVSPTNPSLTALVDRGCLQPVRAELLLRLEQRHFDRHHDDPDGQRDVGADGGRPARFADVQHRIHRR